MTAAFTASTLESPTGASLRLYHAQASGSPRGIILVQHGLSEHAARYRDFAVAMAERGYHVYAHDHRGHGETIAKDAPRGRFATTGGCNKVIGDVMAVRSLARSEHPGLPVVLFGHSMGGLIALNVAISHPDAFAAIALWNSNFSAGIGASAARAILAAESMFKGADTPSAALPRFTFEAWAAAIPDRKTDFDWLSHDMSEVRAYVEDELCGFPPTVSLWQDVFQFIERGGNPVNWRYIDRNMPIHLLGGGQDPATDNGKAVTKLAEKMRAAGFNRVTLTIEQALRHETLKEIGATRTISDFATWLERVLTPPAMTSQQGIAS